MRRAKTGPRTFFRATRWATAIGIVAACGSAVLYPGGTPLDASTSRYDPMRNFLSDLGMTVAYDGHSNHLGAALFFASLAVIVIGMCGCLVGLIRLHQRAPASRRLMYAAGASGAVVAAAFLGVALTPEDRAMGLHVQLTFFAFRSFPVIAVLLALAAYCDGFGARRLVPGWVVLASALLSFVVVLDWGPPPSTAHGLVVQVCAQKLIALTTLAIVAYQSAVAERVSCDRITEARGT